uniref:Cation-transporting P-type ATPase N-terminal domain-containing protein n=1 Tax=Strigamia maritima TaxID=126957 RepID=T1J2X5_STRMM
PIKFRILVEKWPLPSHKKKRQLDERTDSYRVAVSPSFVPDDGRTFDGRPKSRRRRPASTTKSNKSLASIAEEVDMIKAQIDMDEHFIPLDELYSRYATHPSMGLTVPRVQEVQNMYGPNSRFTPTGTPEWVRLLKNIFGGFSVILWAGCCLSLITYSIQTDIMESAPFENLVLGILLGIIAIVTGLYSFYQEMKAEVLIQRFRAVVPEFCSVIREGRWQIIPTYDLAMGDVVEVKAGERIPADIRIIHAHNFKVDQSSMSGDLEPQTKSAEFTSNNPLETLNIGFCDTYATEGYCRGVVIRTGNMTISASLSHFTVSLQESDIFLTDEVTWWMQFFMLVATTVATLMFIHAFITGFHWLDSMIFLVGVLIAIIPEGLVAVVTICLTLTAKRLYNKNCLVKTMSCVEKIGAASVILTDRTGILTQNLPMVSHMWIDGRMVDANETENQTGSAFGSLRRIAMLCNQAETDENGRFVGESDEVALLNYMGDPFEMRQRNRKVCEIPFNRNGKFHVSIHESNKAGESGYFLLMKGSPEEIIQRCSTIVQSGKEWQLDDKTRDSLTAAFIEMASMGEKVISFCDYKLPPQKFPPGYPFDADEVNFPMSNLRFLGLVSLSDPLRPPVPDAIARCRSAGVRVIMITGDHPIAAQATARACGLFAVDSWTIEDIANSKNISLEAVDPR